MKKKLFGRACKPEITTPYKCVEVVPNIWEWCKMCTKCKKMLPLYQYEKHKEKWDGLLSYCKECHHGKNYYRGKHAVNHA